MKILASGCSFTAGKNTWPSYVLPDAEVVNLAVVAAGNQYISQSVIAEMAQNQYDLVLVMWSGLMRKDLQISDTTYQQLEAPIYRKKINNMSFACVGNMRAGISDSRFAKYKQEYFELVDEESSACQSLLHIIALESFLKNKKIPYRFMSYINYWKDQEKLINLNFGVHKHPTSSTLAECIDYDNFLFYNQQESFYEFAKNKELLEEDNFHPTRPAHQAWGEWIGTQI
jgi:hypothetical protein